MSNDDYLSILAQGVAQWNQWRDENPGVTPNLAHANLQGLFQTGLAIKAFSSPLQRVNFSGMYLQDAFIESADLSYADLSGCDLSGATLNGADLSHANLTNARLVDTNLKGASLDNANLTGANLMRATLVETSMCGTNLSACNIFGVSVWGIRLDEKTNQSNLLIENYNQPSIRVPSLEMAQLIYLLLDDRTKLRDLLSGIGERGVLILGRFEPKRKAVLDAVADALTLKGYMPIMFDFESIPGRNYTETIVLLAGMAKFIIADLSDAKSLPQEAQAITSQIDVPFMSIIEHGQNPWSMMDDIIQHQYVDKKVIAYSSQQKLIDNIDRIISRAEEQVALMRLNKSKTKIKVVEVEEV